MNKIIAAIDQTIVQIVWLWLLTMLGLIVPLIAGYDTSQAIGWAMLFVLCFIGAGLVYALMSAPLRD